MPYYDYAATTPLDTAVFEKMRQYFITDFGNSSSIHSYGRAALKGLDDARESIAALINAQPSEIYFTSGGTEADNWAIKGTVGNCKANKKKIIIGATEHPAVIESANALARLGYTVEKAMPDGNGVISAETVIKMLSDDVCLVSVMYANNETGTKNPISSIAEACKSKGVIFHTDAVQAASFESVDVKALGVNLMSVSAHKFYGPKGAGFLYIKSGTNVLPLISGGYQERSLRGGTVNVPNAVGLALAFEKIKAEKQEGERISGIRQLFERKVLSNINDVFVNGTDRVPSICNLTVKGVNNSALLAALDLKGIAISSGSACTAGTLKASHVLAAMGRTPEEVNSTVRFSFGRYNTAEETINTAEQLCRTVEELRRI